LALIKILKNRKIIKNKFNIVEFSAMFKHITSHFGN
jgi:hypothetical protein